MGVDGHHRATRAARRGVRQVPVQQVNFRMVTTESRGFDFYRWQVGI
jgi:hypothetical protein